MNVLYLSPSGELGGAEIALLEMMASLRTARPDWVLTLITAAGGPLIERASACGVTAVTLPFPAQLARLGEWGLRGSFGGRMRLAAGLARAAAPAFAYASLLRRRMSEFSPDIVHTNGLKMHVLGARSRPPRARVMWHLHDYPSSRPAAAAILRAHVRRCAMMLASSKSVANDARALFGARVPVRTVYNAVNLERFRPAGRALDLDALANLPPASAGTVRVGLIGTFARWKGHDVFLRALSLIRATDVRGYIIGGPIYQTDSSQFSMDELKELARRFGLGDSVAFTGRIDDVPGAIRALDIVVHASVEPEPFGLVVAEAMACGKPVIASRGGGASEIAQSGALFHEPGDAEHLAARISELIHNPTQRASLGAAGHAAALQLFDARRLAEALIPIYEALATAG